MCNIPCVLSFFFSGWSIGGDGGGNRSEFRRADGSDEKDVREHQARGKWHPWTQKKNSPTDIKTNALLFCTYTHVTSEVSYEMSWDLVFYSVFASSL